MMAEMSPGAALRELQHAHASLKKARELLRQGADSGREIAPLFDAGWSSLRNAHRVMAAIPCEAVDDEVMTKQLALERYATALLVRLRRRKRRESTDQSLGRDDSDEYGDEDRED
jgi:hypothetical protein